MAKAIKENKYLPAAIVIVLDNDFTHQLNLPKNPKHPEIKLLLEVMIEDLHRLCADYKSNLPEKCKRQFTPHILWIIPPTHKYFHDNTLRDMLGRILQDIIEDEDSIYHEMCCLKLKKCWDERNGSFYLFEQGRYTPIGLMNYWLGVDAAIKFWSKTLQEVLARKQKKAASNENAIKPRNMPTVQSTVTKVEHSTKENRCGHSVSKYVWRKLSAYEERRPSQQRRLPPPPPRRY